MSNLPACIITLWAPFADLFDPRTWRKVQILVAGTILAPGKRPVSAALYVRGLQDESRLAVYPQVLSRARGSSLAVSRVWLGLWLRHLAPATGPLLFGIDETGERRKGPRIAAKGVYRDGVRASHRHFVKAMGLRGVCLMWRADLPWAGRVGARPFLTALAPSPRYPAARGLRHRTRTDGARPRLRCRRRWVPDREWVVVGDRRYACLRLLAACPHMSPAITFLTRLRRDAALYDPPPARTPGQTGRPRRVGARQPSLRPRRTDPATRGTDWVPRWPNGTVKRLPYATGTALGYRTGPPRVRLRWVRLRDPARPRAAQALLSTDPRLAPATVLTGYLHRGQGEVTCQEVRAHLGVQTQRQGSAAAMARTTPALWGLFRWLVRVAHRLHRQRPWRSRCAAWYPQTRPTCADVLACVRQALRTGDLFFPRSPPETDIRKRPPSPPAQSLDTLCYTA